MNKSWILHMSLASHALLVWVPLDLGTADTCKRLITIGYISLITLSPYLLVSIDEGHYISITPYTH